MFGRLGNPNLESESATHYTASVERSFGDRMRLLVEVYDREDDELFFTPVLMALGSTAAYSDNSIECYPSCPRPASS